MIEIHFPDVIISLERKKESYLVPVTKQEKKNHHEQTVGIAQDTTGQ